jgi:adenylate cyclase class 2
MTVEVEVKAKAPIEILDRLNEISSKLSGIENHLDVYFSGPRDFSVTDEALRIRRKESGAYLTYKGPKLDRQTKSRKEVTVRIDDPSAMEDVLLSLGFCRFAIVKKRRAKYSYEDMTIAVDDVEGLGRFVEVECIAGSDWEKKRDSVLSLISTLGCTELITSSYLELLLQQA